MFIENMYDITINKSRELINFEGKTIIDLYCEKGESSFHLFKSLKAAKIIGIDCSLWNIEIAIERL